MGRSNANTKTTWRFTEADGKRTGVRVMTVTHRRTVGGSERSTATACEHLGLDRKTTSVRVDFDNERVHPDGMTVERDVTLECMKTGAVHTAVVMARL